MGLLKTKSILMATHLPEYVCHADEVIVLEKGVVKARGTYDEMSAFGYITSRTMDSVDDMTDDRVEENESTREGSDEKIVAEVEEGSVGHVTLGLFWNFFRIGNTHLGIVLLGLAFIFNQVVLSFSDLYLQVWTAHEEEPGMDKETKDWDIVIYSASMIPLLVVPFIRSWAHFAACLRSVAELHSAFIRSVMHAPMRFFETNSMGRILNRASKDMGLADQGVPQVLFSVIGVSQSSAPKNAEYSSDSDVVQLFLQGVGTLVVVSIVNPLLIIPSILVLIALYFARKLYLNAASKIALLESISKLFKCLLLGFGSP